MATMAPGGMPGLGGTPLTVMVYDLQTSTPHHLSAPGIPLIHHATRRQPLSPPRFRTKLGHARLHGCLYRTLSA